MSKGKSKQKNKQNNPTISPNNQKSISNDNYDIQKIVPYYSDNQTLTNEYMKKYGDLKIIDERLKQKEESLSKREEAIIMMEKEWETKNIEFRETQCIYKEKDLAEKETKIKEEIDSNSKDRIEIENLFQQYEEKERQLKVREVELLEREAMISDREHFAELGFIAQRKQVYEEYSSKMNENKKSFMELYEKVISSADHSYEKLADYLNILQDKWNKNIDEILSNQSKYEKELFTIQQKVLNNISEEKRVIFEKEATLKVQNEFLEDDKIIKIQEQKERYEQEINYLKGINEILKKRLEEYETKISENKMLEYRAGLLDQIGLRSENEMLRNKIEQYEIELKTRLPIADQNKIQILSNEIEKLQMQIEEKNVEISLLETNKSNWANKFYELETIKKEKDSLSIQNRNLINRIGELDAELEKYNPTKQEGLVFPSCSSIDNEIEKSRIRIVNNKLPNERNIIPLLRRKIFEFYPEKGLNYSEADIRAILSGMAMSKLIILEGISGTGKSSLPEVLSKVINGECDKIEIQAGWRDRHDLLGYYNSFEKKYYESPFLISLYKSQHSNYKNIPYFILLDEMNLSHPEYYFADFLSELERNNENNRKIKLLPKNYSFQIYPRLFESNIEGMYIKIPQNVWFIGTANNDETTMGFADKTYDRAFVLELPDIKPKDRPLNTNEILEPISYTDLSRIYKNADDKWKQKVDVVKNIFSTQILPAFKESFNISWGNRLDSGIEKFTAANLELGGSIEESIDYILAFKILHKIKNHKNYDKDKVIEYEIILDDIKSKNKLTGDFSKSSKYIEIIKDNSL